MRTSIAALVCACALAASACVAAAETIEIPNGNLGFTTTWPSFEVEAAGITIRCPLTLAGTFNTRSIDTSTRVTVGTVGSARQGTCSSGSGGVVPSSLPWQLAYAGFTGTLPVITGLRLRLVNAAFSGQILGITCQLRPTEVEPAYLVANISNQEVVSVTADPTTTIRLEGGRFCQIGSAGRLRGTSGPLVTQQGGQRVNVVQGPAANGPWVVSVGDSFISGEAGRWAGNTTASPPRNDRLGPRAYFDNGNRTAELIPLCHRSNEDAAVIHIGQNGGPRSLNLACSGATARSQTIGTTFKPGLDLETPNSQAAQLRTFARTNTVRMVVVSIGGNDFHFAEIITNCVSRFLAQALAYCRNHEGTTRFISQTERNARFDDIRRALRSVRQAMQEAQYDDDRYRIVVLNYESLLPPVGDGFVPAETRIARLARGCPIYNTDAEWLNTTVLPAVNNTVRSAVTSLEFGATVEQLELRDAFLGRRLCEQGTGLLEAVPGSSWFDQGVVDRTEWVNVIRTALDTPDLKQQESIHPNNWGQHAVRACLRFAWNNGAIREGSCRPLAPGLTPLGDPRMEFRPTP